MKNIEIYKIPKMADYRFLLYSSVYDFRSERSRFRSAKKCQKVDFFTPLKQPEIPSTKKRPKMSKKCKISGGAFVENCKISKNSIN
jgi:hypothetical protein